MDSFAITYRDKKLSITINGKELPDVRHIELLLPIYTNPILKINQHINSEPHVDQSVMTAITGIGEVTVKGSLTDGCFGNS